MPKKYVVQLSADQRSQRYALIQRGNAPTRTIRRAHTLLPADDEQLAATIAAVLHTSDVTVTQTWKRYLTVGLEAALYNRLRPGACRKLDGRQEAHLIVLACSAPPPGEHAGACGCWPTAPSSWALWRTFPLRQSGGCCKKPPQAVVEGAMGYPRRERRVRHPDGRPARSVRRT
jgi:hypothetical protein